MANKNTRRIRATRDGYRVKTGRCINSSEARKASGRKPYWAPSRKENKHQ